MKIKNIKEYRTFYKAIRQSESKDESFIGNSYLDEKEDKKILGWFDIYHGDKEGFGNPEDGIRNFLESFLDMAKDGQAVYEFLQNAVDSGSSHFSMIWGEDELDGNHYLLVTNNGQMFSMNDVRSILNVGGSTKSNDSQTIGKFGIGFKLAHRLVGKSNGLEELINENSGPLLFSWKDYALKEMIESDAIEPVDIDIIKIGHNNYSSNDSNPWLFKILITCFPCLPENGYVEEYPRLVNGEVSNITPFSSQEYATLRRWVTQNQNVLNIDTYSEGSLFFLKLGSGKVEELGDTNLKEGIKFAIGVLNQTSKEQKSLNTVQINQEDAINAPKLDYVKLVISKESDKNTYAYVRFGVEGYDKLSESQRNQMEKEVDIDILYGFRKYNKIGNYFKGAPNLYLFFPLSEEVHNFNYILHSNAFYKGSSRTFLHKGTITEDGINERLLKIIVKRVQQEFNRLSSSDKLEERELFLNFYAAILTSKQSANQDRLWIKEPYIDSLDGILKEFVPFALEDTRFDVTANHDNIFIRDTDIDISNFSLANIKWFYFDESELRIQALDKLKIKKYSIFNLLSIAGISEHINNWLEKDTNRIELVLKELDELEGQSQSKAELIENIRQELVQVKILKFINGESLSIKEFLDKEEQGYLIPYGSLYESKDIFKKLKINITTIDYTGFIEKYRTYLLQTSKHGAHKDFTILFSDIVDNSLLVKLSIEDKNKLYNSFRSLSTDGVGERVKELKLFCNRLGKPVKIKSLLPSTVTSWYKIFSIKQEEEFSLLTAHLLNEEKDYYQHLFYPFWSDVLNYLKNNQSQVADIIKNIDSFYTQSRWDKRGESLLGSQQLIIYKNEVVKATNVFLNSDLKDINSEEFLKIQDIVLKYIGWHIPDSFLINQLDEIPISFTFVKADIQLDELEMDFENISVLLSFCFKCSINLFKNHIVSFEEGKYKIIYNTASKQYQSDSKEEKKYIDTYYSELLKPLPSNLEPYKGMVELRRSTLINFLIEEFEELNKENISQELDLIELVLASTGEDQKLLFDKLASIPLDTSWKETRQNELYLKFISELDKVPLDVLQAKILVENEDSQLNLSDIDSSEDSIELEKDSFKVILSQSKILNLDDAEVIKSINEFSKQIIQRELLSKSKAEQIFKISSTVIDEAFYTKFEDKLEANDFDLVNSHQLAFVLLSEYYLDREKCSKFYVKQAENSWCSLKGVNLVYSENNLKHIDPKYMFCPNQYEDLQEVLGLNDISFLRYTDYDNLEDIIACNFLFVKGFDTIFLESKEPVSLKLDYLFQGWKGVRQDQRYKLEKKEWTSYLEIKPNQYVLKGKSIDIEILPDEFIKWVNNEKEKEQFLKYIGVYVSYDKLENLRKYLLKEIDVLPQDISIDDFNDTILENTLVGLSGDFDKLGEAVCYSIDIDYDRIVLIERIISKLLEEDITCPLLVYKTSTSFILVNQDDCIMYTIEEELHNQLRLNANNNLGIIYSNYNIVRSILDIDYFQDISELELLQEFIVPKEKIEHNEPYYHKWSSDNSIVLFKTNEIQFNVYVDYEERQTWIGVINGDEFLINEDNNEDITEIFYKQDIYLEGLSKSLSTDHTDYEKKIEELIVNKNLMLANFFNALNNTSTENILNDIFRKESLRIERKQLIEDFTNLNKYSYNWFKNYIKYLLTFDSVNTNSSTSKTISFSQVKRHIIDNRVSEKYFLLCGASSYLSESIEDATNFVLKIGLKSTKKIYDLVIEGVQKNGQDLFVFSSKELPKEVLDNLEEIYLLEIAFIPCLNLFKELSTVFLNENNLDSWDSILDSLPAIEFIYGPPGTGKTTTLCSKIEEIKQEKENAKILFLSPTNKAADVLCKRLILNRNKKTNESAGELTGRDYISVHRLGNPTDPEIEELDPDVYINKVDNGILDYINVLAMTIHRIPYTKVFNDSNEDEIKLFKKENYWDYVVFDEASMINLTYLVFTLMSISKFSPNTKFIVAGDPKQIPPIVDLNDKDLEELDIKEENIYTMMNIYSFKKEEQVTREQDSILNLDIQYRSVAEIGQLFSELSYNNLLTHGRESLKDDVVKQLPKDFMKVISDSVTFVNIPLDLEDSIFKVRKLLNGSSYHIYSAILISEIIKYLDTTLKDEESWTIGIISPYKAQSVIINKIINSLNISDRIKICADTVHAFQGDQCDLVFFVANPNNYSYTGHKQSLLSKEYIYNVAISRARDYLVVLHPFDAIRGNEYINKLTTIYQSNFGKLNLKNSKEIEQIIFEGEANYIKENSFIMGHDNVNIFTESEKAYFMRADSYTIDIQLKNK